MRNHAEVYTAVVGLYGLGYGVPGLTWSLEPSEALDQRGVVNLDVAPAKAIRGPQPPLAMLPSSGPPAIPK